MLSTWGLFSDVILANECSCCPSQTRFTSAPELSKPQSSPPSASSSRIAPTLPRSPRTAAATGSSEVQATATSGFRAIRLLSSSSLRLLQEIQQLCRPPIRMVNAQGGSGLGGSLFTPALSRQYQRQV